VVLNCWVTDRNETPWASNSSTSLAKSAASTMPMPAITVALRLEPENVGGKFVVHNYGHGGAAHTERRPLTELSSQ
jgi:hypothetical protein